MQRLEEWPSSTEFGLQAVCNMAPALLTDVRGLLFAASANGNAAGMACLFDRLGIGEWQRGASLTLFTATDLVPCIPQG
jgi:hypothetical protein